MCEEAVTLRLQAQGSLHFTCAAELFFIVLDAVDSKPIVIHTPGLRYYRIYQATESKSRLPIPELCPGMEDVF